MILLWGLPADPPLTRVHQALLNLDADVQFLDQRSTVAARAELSVDTGLRATLQTGGVDFDLEACTAAYVRPYDTAALAVVRRAGIGSDTWERAVRIDELLVDWSDLTEALVVNRPSAGALNASKPMQAERLRSLGFSVPDTIITTDPDAVRDFRERHPRVLYKSVSGIRSIVSELTDEHLARLDSVCWCPTQFQECVPGIDYRVHVIGDDIFTHEIESDAVDYRYAARHGLGAVVRSGVLPDDVAELSVAATRDMGLVFGGVDLRRTPAGEWYCFEVNPSPGFTYFQDWTGQRIDEAVAAALIAGATGSGARGPVLSAPGAVSA